MTDFWEEKFNREEMMWGQIPSDSAILVKDFFLEHKISNILIPGIGYGRNAKIFYDSGIHITGIEISKSAIKMAHKDISMKIPIHLGSVTEMPFDSKRYDGVFCYSLIHLLNKTERKNFISNCYKQLLPNGYMFFVVISNKSNMFGTGKKLSENRYEISKGLNVYFYDALTIKQEFKDFGLLSIEEIDEPIKYVENEPPLKCFLIKCQQKNLL